MNANDATKLQHAYENDRADDMIYNMHKGEMGIRVKPHDDTKYTDVIVMSMLPTEARWFDGDCVDMWGVYKSARVFIHEYMQPIYVACFTLDMRDDMERVLTISRAMCADEGEGFAGEMLDTMVACGTKTDIVSVAIHEVIREYVEENCNI